MHPHVGRIHVDEDGHIAEDANAAARGSLAQLVPLHGEGKLQHLFLGECAACVAAIASARACGSALRSGSGHAVHAPVFRLAAQHGVEGVVVEPAGLRAAELFKLRPLARRKCRGSCGARSRKFPAASRSRGSLRGLHLLEINIAGCARQGRRCAGRAIHPQSARTSRLMSEGLPANADEPA